MKNNVSLKDMGNIMHKAESVLIFPHVNPDGDALGSAIALCRGLRNLGKTAWVLLDEKLPEYLDFLDGSCCTYNQGHVENPDVCICVDCSEGKRLPDRIEAYNSGKVNLCIDHHATGEGFGDYFYIDDGEAATAQIIYKLFEVMGWEINRTIADHLYVGIVTDTGCFQHSNTTDETHAIISKLFGIGISHTDIMVRLYQSVSPAKIAIKSEILRRMQLFADGRVAIGYVTHDMLRETGAVQDDAEGAVDILRDIDGVELAAFLKENDEIIKVSMRAKSYGSVDGIAMKFGGGGHVKAAGFAIRMSMGEAIETVKNELVKSLE